MRLILAVLDAARLSVAWVACAQFGCSEPGVSGFTADAGGGAQSSAAGGTAAKGAGSPADAGSTPASGGSSTTGGVSPVGGATSGGQPGSSGTANLDVGKGGGVGFGGAAGTAGATAMGSGSTTGGSVAGGGVAGAGGRSNVPPGSAPVFVALGHLGRTLVSCDDGLTWGFDRDEDPSNLLSCASIDCDHNLYSAKDFTYAAGFFVSTLGWGNPSSVRRSRDGYHWETVTTSFANYDFDNVIGNEAGRFILLDRYDARTSADHGKTWVTLGEIPLGNEIYNVRVAGLAGSKIVAFADQRTIHWSSDWGASWHRPSVIEASCNFDFYNSGIASGKGLTLTVGTSGKGCYTADDAETFHGLDTTLSESLGQVLWTGTEFMMWGVNRVARSTDGVAWTTVPTSVTPAGSFRPETVVKAPDGAYVAASGQYETQGFFRSTDGVAWQRVASAPRGHPIRKIVAGYAPSELACKP